MALADNLTQVKTPMRQRAWLDPVNTSITIVLLILAFIVLIGTFLFISRLRRSKLPRLPSIEQGEPGDPFQLRFNWPIVDRFLNRAERLHAALPGYYRPIGALYGILASAVTCILLVLAHKVASILGLVVGYVGISYSLESISQALQKRNFLRIPVAVVGSVLGISVVTLHIAALFGRRLLPAWSP